MQGMQRWIRVFVLLGGSMLSLCTPQEDAVTNAINTCNHELKTDFDFKLLEAPTINPQNKGKFFKYSSYRPSLLLRQLFPWLYKPQRYQFVLTTAWKRPLTEASPGPEMENSTDVVVRTCSGFFTNQEPIKYMISCDNVTQEETGEEKTVEVTPITPSAAEEGSGSTQEEDEGWDLSRCLGCIFGMLNKPLVQ